LHKIIEFYKRIVDFPLQVPLIELDLLFVNAGSRRKHSLLHYSVKGLQHDVFSVLWGDTEIGVEGNINLDWNADECTFEEISFV